MEEKICSSPLSLSLTETLIAISVLAGYMIATKEFDWQYLIILAVILFIFYFSINSFAKKDQVQTQQ